MKINHLGIVLFLLLSIGGCKKESPTPKTSTASNNIFKLKKDGVPYTANYVFVSLIDENNALAVETRTVYQEVYNNTYGVFIQRSISPGTYVLEDGESDYFAIYHIQDSNTMFGWEHGTLTVLSNDTIQKVMHCNFEVKLFNDEIDQYPELTEGEMTIHY